MTGRGLFILLAGVALTFGGGLYYTINYAYYDASEHARLPLADVALELANAQLLTGTTSPLKYRICADAVNLDAFPIAEQANPLVAPRWFSCFDAGVLQTAIDDGAVAGHLVASNEPYGIDLMGLNYDGRSYFWRQLNECGEARFSGDKLPENCPEVE